MVVSGTGGRRPSPVWKTDIFLLPGPDIDVLPSPSEVSRLRNHGLGGIFLLNVSNELRYLLYLHNVTQGGAVACDVIILNDNIL